VGRGGVRLTTAAGKPTGALYVFANMLVRLYLDRRPERIAVVFDAPGRTFRDDIDEQYKATRREVPDDLKRQMADFQPLTEAFSWPVLAIPGVEADDVIATLVAQARARDWDAIVYSGDKDLMQLVGDGVTVHDQLRQITYDAAAVEKKFGVSPKQLRDYLALVGDKSDNVPGMPGVGKKTATTLLSKYGSIDGILAHTGALRGKQRERFEDPALVSGLETSRELVTLRDDVELGVSIDELVPRPWDGERLRELFYELEFQVLLTRLEGNAPKASATGSPSSSSSSSSSSSGAVSSGAVSAEAAAVASSSGPLFASVRASSGSSGAGSEAAASGATAPAGAATARSTSALAPPAIQDPQVVLTAEALASVAAAARDVGRVALHVETDGRRWDRAALVGLAMAIPGRAPAYVPLAHRYLSVPAQLSTDVFAHELGAALGDPDIAIVGHDVKEIERTLAELGVALRGVDFDTMLAAYLLDVDRSFLLERVIAGAVGIKLPTRKQLLGSGRSKIEFEALSVEEAARYAGTAAGAVLLAADELGRRIETAGLGELLGDLELPLASLLARVERIGVCLDVPYLRALASEAGGQLATLEKQIFEAAGAEINLGSPKQLAKLLFETLGLSSDKMRKTKTGYSTDHEVLESLLDAHPAIAPIIEHRELGKLKSTYLDALPPLVNPRTRRIHTRFEQAVAATGRLSSQDPNLQNIPIRTELGRRIRRAFVADEGMVLVSVDYSQIELRILAHLSQDPVLVRAFQSDIDVHTQTAAEVFQIPLDQVGSTERRVAKAVNYGLVYGQTDFGLSRALGIARSEARGYIERYFERFARVRAFMDEVVEQARTAGAATTIMGRRRPIPDLRHKNYQRRKAAERVAQNTPMQGSAADIIKVAMLRVARRLDAEALPARMLLTVHDELVFEVPPDRVSELTEVAVAEMEGAAALSVPLRVDVGVAKNWAEAHG
jgi:DNA polymerase-1